MLLYHFCVQLFLGLLSFTSVVSSFEGSVAVLFTQVDQLGARRHRIYITLFDRFLRDFGYFMMYVIRVQVGQTSGGYLVHSSVRFVIRVHYHRDGYERHVATTKFRAGKDLFTGLVFGNAYLEFAHYGHGLYVYVCHDSLTVGALRRKFVFVTVFRRFGGLLATGVVKG